MIVVIIIIIMMMMWHYQLDIENSVKMKKLLTKVKEN